MAVKEEKITKSSRKKLQNFKKWQNFTNKNWPKGYRKNVSNIWKKNGQNSRISKNARKIDEKFGNNGREKLTKIEEMPNFKK